MLIEKKIKLQKPDLFKGDYGKELGLESVGILRGRMPITRYTDGTNIYDIDLYNIGKTETIRTDIDDYIMVSDRIALVAVPMFRADKATKEARDATDNFKKSIDFSRGEATKEDLEKFKAILEEYKDCLEPVTFDYLESKGIQTDRDKLKFEVHPLSIDLCTGRKAYTIIATLQNPKGDKWIYSLKQRKMPLNLWKKIKPYMEYYNGRSDNFDPMYEVEKGTYYTFNPKKVKEIIKKWEDA